MGRKVHPNGFRLGIVREHRSRWFANGPAYVEHLVEDRTIRATVHSWPKLPTEQPRPLGLMQPPDSASASLPLGWVSHC